MTQHPDLGFTYEYRPAPTGSQEPAHTLLLLHGTGGDENSLLALAERVAPGAALLSPRGKVDEDGNARWFRRMGPGRFDVDDMVARVADLAGFVERACEAFDLDPAGVRALGFSNGATTAVALAFEHPAVLAGAVVLSGMKPFDRQGRILDGKGFLCGHGRHDNLVDAAQYEDLVELLVGAAAEVVFRWYDAGHEIPAEAERDITWWLARQLEQV